MVKHVILFILLLMTIQTANSSKVICSTKPKTIHLKLNEISFFETPNFPQPGPDNCSIIYVYNVFSLSLSNILKTRFVYAITNPHKIKDVYIQKIESIFEIKLPLLLPIPLRLSFTLAPKFEAFQGFALFEDQLNSCALGSISQSQTQPYLFTDDTQILYIRTTYYDIPLLKQNCKWQFIGPEGYGFKIVFEQLNIFSSFITFTVLNSTGYVITNQDLAKPHQAYYNNDNNLKILFFIGNASFLNGFQAYVTIVKNNPIFILEKCSNTSIEGGVITNWTNIRNDSYGYSNTAKCFFNLEVKPGTEVLALVTTGTGKMDMETNVDVIKFTDDEYGVAQLTDDTSFRTYKNNTIKKYNFEFTSDGSIQGIGFNVVFLKLDCQCSATEFHVYCDGRAGYRLTNSTNLYQYWGYYCSNLKCNFTILSNSSCMNKLIEIMLWLPEHYSETLDIFKVTSNDSIVLNSNNSKNINQMKAYLSPQNENIFQALTYVSPFARYLTISFNTIEIPTIYKHIILTEKHSTYALDLQNVEKHHLILVELGHEFENSNATIEIYVNFENPTSLYNFYNNENLTFELDLNDCFLNSKTISKFQCDTQANKLAMVFASLANFDTAYNYLIFQISNYNYEGCIFKKNVYFLGILDDTIQHSPMVNIANQEKPCTIFILTYPIYPAYLSRVWTNAKKENVYIYAGNSNKKPILNYNSTTSDQWKNIFLYSRIYSVVIPINSSIIIDYKTPLFILPFNLKGTEKSALATFGYGEGFIYKSFITSTIADYNALFNTTLKVTVVDVKINPSWKLYILENNIIKHNITHVGQTMTFSNSVIFFHYERENQAMYNTSLAEYLVYIEVTETQKNNKTNENGGITETNLLTYHSDNNFHDKFHSVCPCFNFNFFNYMFLFLILMIF